MMEWDGIATTILGEEEGVGAPRVATCLLTRMLQTSCATVDTFYYHFVDSCCTIGRDQACGSACRSVLRGSGWPANARLFL